MSKQPHQTSRSSSKIRSQTVSVIVPTFNGLPLMKKHLDSWLANLITGDELLIVDDQSSDKTSDWLIDRFKLIKAQVLKDYQVYFNSEFEHGSDLSIQIKLIVNSKNKRFAKSCNLAVDLAQNDLVFLLNNDVRLGNNCLNTLVTNFDQDGVFGVGCLEYEGQDKSGTKSGKNLLWFEKGLLTHSRANNFESGQTAWVSGGSGMFNRKKWQMLGGFDPKYHPAYWEDIDLSFRARKRGWQVLFDAKAVVFHQHESTNAQVFSLGQIQKLSWHHNDYMTWKLGHVWQRLAFLIWRPYWWYQRLKQKRT
ncbi:MAG: glycosyltransferase [Patescibacteria group bacterium]